MTFSTLEERHRAITRLCMEHELNPSLLEALGGAERWKTYRRMVRARLSGMVKSGLPRTVRTLGKERTTALLADWLAGGGMKSAYIRDAVPSFVEAIDWQTVCGDAEPWLADLARYEATLWQLRHIETAEQAVEDFAFEAIPAVNHATQVMELEFPVYRIKQTEFEPETKHVLLFRHMLTDKVGYITLTDLQSTLFDQCATEALPMTACVQAAAKEHGLSIDESLLEQVSSFLAELMSRTIVVGSYPASS